MKRIQPKTLLIINRILEKKIFSQKDILLACNDIRPVSVGLVNKVMNDLISKNYVRARSKWEMDYGNLEPEERAGRRPKYYLSDPVGLLTYVSLFRSMKDLLLFEMWVDGSKDMIMDELKGQKVVYSLGSALESSSAYYRSVDVTLYSDDPAAVQDVLKRAPPGKTGVKCYRFDLLDEIDPKSDLFKKDDKGRHITSDVQSIIDMFCDGKSAYTKPLLDKLWGIKI